MNNFVLFAFGCLIVVAIVVLAILRKLFSKPEPVRQLMFLGYQDIDRCRGCKGFLVTRHDCLCGCAYRETVVAIRRTYTDFTVEFEAIEVCPETKQVI